MTNLGRRLTQAEKAESRKRAKEEGLCRWCGLDVHRLSKRRRTFCSDECVHEFLLRSDPGYARKQTYKRDKGICQECGLDCSKWFGEFKRWVRAQPWDWNGDWRAQREAQARAYFEQHKVPYVPDWGHRSTFWDVDHIVEASVAGPCGLDNLRVVCIPCHRAKTVAFNKKRGKKNGKPDDPGPDPGRPAGPAGPADAETRA